jgi:hypothetical protein
MDLIAVVEATPLPDITNRRVIVAPLYTRLSPEMMATWERYRLSMVTLAPRASYILRENRSQLFQLVEGEHVHIGGTAEEEMGAGICQVGDFGCSGPDHLSIDNISLDKAACLLVMRNWGPNPPTESKVVSYDVVPQNWVKPLEYIDDIRTGACYRSLWPEVAYAAGSRYRMYELSNTILTLDATEHLGFWYLHCGTGTFTCDGETRPIDETCYSFIPQFCEIEFSGHGMMLTYIQVPAVRYR